MKLFIVTWVDGRTKQNYARFFTLPEKEDAIRLYDEKKMWHSNVRIFKVEKELKVVRQLVDI